MNRRLDRVYLIIPTGSISDFSLYVSDNNRDRKLGDLARGKTTARSKWS